MPIPIEPGSFSLGAVLGGIIVRMFDHILANRRAQKDREAKSFEDAAKVFKHTILTQLEGIYPVTNFWPEEIFPRFRQSIPKIISAAAEFKHFVSRKNIFDIAVKNYCDYCNKITWESCVNYATYKTSMYEPGAIEPRQRFKNIVEHLLSFADEK